MGYGTAMNSVARRRRPVDFNDPNALVGAQGSTYNSAAGYGDDANASFLSQANQFDASKALNQYARGAFANVSQGLKSMLADDRGRQVGAGRFDSGFADQDSGNIYSRVMSDFTNNLSMQALGAAGMQQRNTESIGQFGLQQQGMATDLLMSRREELENNAREEAERKRKKRSGIGAAIGGALGAAGGFLVGGPAGAYGGYKVGSSVGGAF